MHNIITTENILLIGALLLFVAVMAGKAAYRDRKSTRLNSSHSH